jgi:hypothetical protein
MAKKESTSTVNPFEKGVSYNDVLKAIPDGVSVSEYLAPLGLEEHQVKWIESELKAHTYNETHKEANLARAEKEYAALINADKK